MRITDDGPTKGDTLSLSARELAGFAVKQGGDTIADATVIPGLPYANQGTTVGYNHDYEESCPYFSMSPDVVYSFTPSGDMVITVDLFGSTYDTKVYVYEDAVGNVPLDGCNDDNFDCVDPPVSYTSWIPSIDMLQGHVYYIVVDGYGGGCGDYVLEMTEVECPQPCDVICVGVPEGEPTCYDDYVDNYNGGCNSEEFGAPFQEINWTNDEDGIPPYDGTAWLCGVSGWYLNSNGYEVRDTDWFIVYALETGVMDFTVEPEFPCPIFKLAPTDCNDVGVELSAEADCEAPATLSFPVTAGEEIWLWVGPVEFTGPVTEFTYFMTVSNNTFDVVPNEGMSWGGVKSLYR